MNRDELARRLYIHAPGATREWREAGAIEWDEGLATDDDVRDCYARADQQLAEEAKR